MDDIKKRLFCGVCNNLLRIETIEDELLYRCPLCKTLYETGPDDTLVYEDVKETKVMIYEKLIEKSCYDPAVQKVETRCKKCGDTFGKQIRVGKDMRLVTLCCKCGENTQSQEIVES
jgi:DNA-directed RNA polymerase subunit M/transcription elongation factor TFIIS